MLITEACMYTFLVCIRKSCNKISTWYKAILYKGWVEIVIPQVGVANFPWFYKDWLAYNCVGSGNCSLNIVLNIVKMMLGVKYV